MTNEEVLVKLTDHDNEIGSLKRRMKAAEEATTALNRLAIAVEVMATKQDTIAENVCKLTGKVDTLENVPRKRWEGLVEKVFYSIAAGVVGFMLARMGLS